jgi:hypothetical protein
LDSKQKIPVAVLTTASFDASQIDATTVVFGPDGAHEVHGRAHIKDVDDDGDADLFLHFDGQETGIACGQTVAFLTGETFAGQAVSGSDSIDVVAECVGYNLDLQVSSRVLDPGEQATIRATLRDSSGNLVPYALVEFVLEDPTAGSLSADSITTNVNGQAEVVYTAGTPATTPTAVTITANLAAYPVINDSVGLSIGGQEVFISLGTGNTLIEPDAATYEQPWTVLVTNLEGVGVPEVSVDLSVLSLEYIKGQYAADVLNNLWVPQVTARCFDEDTKFCDVLQEPNGDARCRNGILDTDEDNPLVPNPTGPQQTGGIGNSSGLLEAGNVAALSAGQVATNLSGRADFRIIYGQQFGNWVKVRLRARTTIASIEYSETAEYVLPVTADDVALGVTPPGGVSGIWGASMSCQDTL